jgi:hypothetical protein
MAVQASAHALPHGASARALVPCTGKVTTSPDRLCRSGLTSACLAYLHVWRWDNDLRRLTGETGGRPNRVTGRPATYTKHPALYVISGMTGIVEVWTAILRESNCLFLYRHFDGFNKIRRKKRCFRSPQYRDPKLIDTRHTTVLPFMSWITHFSRPPRTTAHPRVSPSPSPST